MRSQPNKPSVNCEGLVLTREEVATALSFLARHEKDHSGFFVLLILGVGFLMSYFYGSWLSSLMNLSGWAAYLCFLGVFLLAVVVTTYLRNAWHERFVEPRRELNAVNTYRRVVAEAQMLLQGHRALIGHWIREAHVRLCRAEYLSKQRHDELVDVLTDCMKAIAAAEGTNDFYFSVLPSLPSPAVTADSIFASNDAYRWVGRQVSEQMLKYHAENEAPPVARIDSMTGAEFERFVANLFRKLGWKVQETGRSGDQGADLIATLAEERLAIQTKCYGSPVGNWAVQEVVASIAVYKAKRGMVVTNSTFTPGAVSLAAANCVELVDGQALCEMALQHEDVS